MLLAALLATAAVGAPAEDPPDRYDPLPTTTLRVAHARMKPAQGGQRLHVTIPAAPGVDAFGDTVAYRWDTHVGGGARCQPGALPGLGAVTAGAVIDAPLPKPPKGWCRGFYGVELDAVISFTTGDTGEETIARAGFEVGSEPKHICHYLGEVTRSWIPGTYRDPASWAVTAQLDDLLGPDGATEDADHYFRRAFRGDPVLQRHWETDDDSFWGFPTSRAEAIRMTKVVDRVLRAGPFHGKRWPGRPKQDPDTRAC